MKATESFKFVGYSNPRRPIGFRRLTPTYGALVTDLDVSETLPADLKACLNQALTQHQVLLLRNQQLTENQQVEFARLFGTCGVPWQASHYPSGNANTHYLSNVDAEGIPIGRHPDPHAGYWHCDGSWSRTPYRATVLHAIRVPDDGGVTQFANLYEVYNRLDPSTRNRLATMYAEHHVEISRAARTGKLFWRHRTAPTDTDSLSGLLVWWVKVLAKRWRNGAVYHPLVRRHPVTGRQTLFIGDHAWRIRGRFWPEGIRLMQEINAMSLPGEALYSHAWQSGDLLIWDNQSVLHRVLPYDYAGQARILRRCVVIE